MVCTVSQTPMTHACESHETRIRRFPRSAQRRLRKLVRGAKPLRELLYTFPGAAFALATGKRPHDMRARAVELAKNGRPLAEVAAALRLPMWLRRLPPEAFAASRWELSDDVDFARRIVNLIPDAAAATPMWLEWVSFGANACDKAFAIWLARRSIYGSDRGYGVPLLPLAAYVWFSQNKGGVAHRQIGKPWHGNMRFHAAVRETREWLERIILDYCLQDESSRTRWREAQKIHGYRFLPLRSADDLNEEGMRMRNCVAAYREKVAVGACLIYSIRIGEKRVATMEIVRATAHSSNARIVQLLGPGNADPEEAVVRAADAWLSRQGKYPIPAGTALGQIPVNCSRWETAWQPYCMAKPDLAPQLLPPKLHALMRLYTDMKQLETYREAS